jgi:hypothetical protein
MSVIVLIWLLRSCRVTYRNFALLEGCSGFDNELAKHFRTIEWWIIPLVLIDLLVSCLSLVTTYFYPLFLSLGVLLICALHLFRFYLPRLKKLSPEKAPGFSRLTIIAIILWTARVAVIFVS